MLSASERRVLEVFRQYLATPGQMVCFSGQQLTSYRSALKHLSEREFLVKEKFKGGYSLTRQGFSAMKNATAKDVAAD